MSLRFAANARLTETRFSTVRYAEPRTTSESGIAVLLTDAAPAHTAITFSVKRSKNLVYRDIYPNVRDLHERILKIEKE
jgi:hypothetical protein